MPFLPTGGLPDSEYASGMNRWYSGWALVSLVVGVACGGRAETDAEIADVETDVPASPPQPATAEAPAAAPRPAEAPVPMTRPIDPRSREGKQLSLLKELNVYCGDCHGAAARASGNVQGDLDFIDDLDQLVQKGLVVPLNAPASPIFKVVTNDSMPPAGVYPRPGKALVELMREVIEPDAFFGDEPEGRLPDADPLTQ
jgi:hypothetical protein